MMNSAIKNTFSGDSSNVSRAGVVVGYTPEDTMKSFLFNQNNKHCINLEEDCLSVLKLPQCDIERALEFLSSDSETESSSMTKITVKNASSITDNSYGDHDKSHGIKNSKSNTDLEMWNGVDNSDGDCTSADISNEFGEMQTDNQMEDDVTSSALSNKLFEQILEDSLRKEQANATTKPTRGHCKSDPGSKPKFSFLRKNAGRAAWCSNVRPDRSSLDKKSKMRSRSNDRETTRQPQEYNNNQQQQQQPVKRVKSMSSTLKKSKMISKTEKPLKGAPKTVHFAATHRSVSDHDLQAAVEPLTVTQVNQKVAEIEDRNLMVLDESQDLDKDLVEFELLEQIANVSINSSIASSIAMYDEENLREKLRKYKNMPPPTSYSQNKYSDSPSNHPPELARVPLKPDRINKKLSTCEEQSENAHITISCNSDIDGDSDEESQDISNNTTTLSEFQESMINNPINLPFENQKSQAFARKISKQNERHKPFDHENQDWIEENPFQLGDMNSDKTKSSTQKTILTLPKVDWTFADPFHQSGSSSDEEDDDNELNREIPPPKENLETIYPSVAVNKHQSNPDDNISVQSAKLKQWVQLLESEVKRFKIENADIETLKKEKEEGLKRLEEEVKVFKKHKEDEMKKFEEYKQSEMKKLKKERKVFDDYQEAMKNMPNKKDRQEIENLKSEMDILKDELLSKESRWQAANTRLKQKVEQLETENAELHSRIHSLEQKRLQLQSQLVSNRNQKPKIESITSKPKQTVTSVSQAVSMKHSNIPIGPLSKEDNNSNKCITGNTKIPNQVKKNAPKATNNNSNKTQKPMKNSVNPSSSDNGIMDIRGSAASDYYTGEEESGSIDLKTNKMNSAPNRNDTEFGITPIAPNIPYAIKIDRANEAIKDELHHPDGILERIYMNGSIDVVYPNGSLKQISADNKSVIVHLYNGDVKQITPDGRVIYFYAQDESSQTTYPNGKEEIIYKNGHKEILHPSGIREINFPDKSIKILHPDSREETFLPNGLVIRINGSGDKEILLPNGQKEIHTSGIKKRIYPDGTTKTVYPDGRQETFYASGRMRVKDRNGNLILDQYISKTSSLTSSN